MIKDKIITRRDYYWQSTQTIQLQVVIVKGFPRVLALISEKNGMQQNPPALLCSICHHKPKIIPNTKIVHFISFHNFGCNGANANRVKNKVEKNIKNSKKKDSGTQMEISLEFSISVLIILLLVKFQPIAIAVPKAEFNQHISLPFLGYLYADE